MKKMMLVVAVALCGSAMAATWNVTTGGNLDDAANWSGSMSEDQTFEISNAPQSAPFTISTSPATMRIVRYNAYAYTNDFGGGTLNLNALHVEYGANLLHRSGTLAPVTDSYITSKGPRSGLTLDGSESVLSVNPQGVKTLTLRAYSVPADVTDAYPYLIVTNGASCTAGRLMMSGAESWGELLVTGVGSSLTVSGSTVLGGNSNENPAKGYARRTLTFTDHAKGALNDTTVGSNSGNNHLVVEDGAEVTIGGTLYLTPKKADAQMYPASSNNLVTVQSGGRLTATRLLIGMNSNATNNTVEVLDGGVLNLGSYGETDYIGWAGQCNTLFVSGEGSCMTADCKVLIVGGSGNDGAGGHNRLIVANGARLKALGDGGISLSNVGGSVDNALVATNGAVVEAAKISVGAQQGLYFDHSTLRLDTGFPLENGARAAFVDSTLSLGRTADFDLCLGNPIQADAEVALTNSTIAIGSRININGTNVMMRLINSQIDFNAAGKWLMIGTGSSNDTGLHRFVFGGANPWMKSTAGSGIYFRGYVEMRFELPKEGFPTDHAVVDASATKFSADKWTRHKFVVDIHPSCPAGTYPLLKGANADKLSIKDQFSLTERSGSRAKFVWDSATQTISVKVKPAGLILLLE